MSSRKALKAFACVTTVVLSLWFLILFNILESKFEILIRWISMLAFVLFGVWVGIDISRKVIQVRRMTVFTIIFFMGFIAAPFVGFGVLMVVSIFPFSRGIEPIIFGGSITGYLLLYTTLWFRLRKKYMNKPLKTQASA